MKRFLYAVALLCLITGTAYATQTTITQEGSFDQTIRKQINDNFDELYDAIKDATGNIATVALTATGDISGDGGDQLFGFRQDQVDSTTVAVTAAQCGKTFVSNSADVMTLPEASTVLGCRYTFASGTADDLDINPADATDLFGMVTVVTGTNTTVVLAPSAGDALRITDIGSSITVEAIGANTWAVVAVNGIVTDVN